MALKQAPDRGVQKSAKRDIVSTYGQRPLGPLRREKADGRRPGRHQAGGQRSIGSVSRWVGQLRHAMRTYGTVVDWA